MLQRPAGMTPQRAFLQTYHNFCLPHGSVRQPLRVGPAPGALASAGAAAAGRETTQPCDLAHTF
jgi:hypothetical protein